MSNLILIIEDDKAIIRLLELSLKTNGYTPVIAENGLSGISRFLSEKPDLVLLDLGLPDVDGMEVLSQIRAVSNTPVIVVSAREKEHEKVEALDNGADDYVTKPFNIGELMARIRVALRKAMPVPLKNDVFSFRGLELNVSSHQVTIEGKLVHLTPIEFRILKLLIENQGKVLTHRFIQSSIWGHDSEDSYQSLRVFMTNLRRKIEKDPTDPEYIITEIGIGYRFIDD
jgi:two-component system KDP operon response regulator KdpE